MRVLRAGDDAPEQLRTQAEQAVVPNYPADHDAWDAGYHGNNR